MSLDMVPMACFLHTWQIDHSLDERLEVWVIDDSSKIAFEVNDIDQIKVN